MMVHSLFMLYVYYILYIKLYIKLYCIYNINNERFKKQIRWYLQYFNGVLQ